jgi:nucleotide-binding universal stress UspA family protein
MIAMTSPTPPAAFLHLVVGYDGSPPAGRALDAAVRLLQGRTGRIEVVYVAHLSSMVSLSPAAIAEMELDFDDIAKDLRASAAKQLDEQAPGWEFQRRQGLIADELIAAATEVHDTDPSKTVVIVVGSSSHAAHRMVGSAAVSLARHAPVPLVIVP